MDTIGLLITEREKVRKKFEKSISETEQDIQIIKKWLGSQKHLPEISGDAVIEFFLTNCKYSIEKTKYVLDMYYTVRFIFPEIFEYSNPNVPHYHETLSTMTTIIPLPKMTAELQRIVVVKYSENVNSAYSPYKMVAHAANLLEILSHEDLMMGLVVIFDNKNMKMEHVKKLTPTFFRKGLAIFENASSIRIAKIHIINHQQRFMEVLFRIAKKFLKKKFLDRIFFHKDYNTLHQQVPQELLPSDYNGKQMSLDKLEELWKVKFKEYGDRFDVLHHMEINEDLREKPLENSEILGYYGNFKQLDID
uniref:Alpha-tocopherol transfer protein-like n=1 Tax=Diabrotica virgifera virgifera TaxID=50390 RepID=A0A6P7GFC8_DIAVI